MNWIEERIKQLKETISYHQGCLADDEICTDHKMHKALIESNMKHLHDLEKILKEGYEVCKPVCPECNGSGYVSKGCFMFLSRCVKRMGAGKIKQ